MQQNVSGSLGFEKRRNYLWSGAGIHLRLAFLVNWLEDDNGDVRGEALDQHAREIWDHDDRRPLPRIQNSELWRLGLFGKSAPHLPRALMT